MLATLATGIASLLAMATVEHATVVVWVQGSGPGRVPGARVVIGAERPWAAALTDSSGGVRFHGPQPSWIAVDAPPYVPLMVPFSTREMLIEVETGFGFKFSLEPAEAVERARVVAVRSERGVVFVREAERKGRRWRVTGLDDGIWNLVARAPGFAPAVTEISLPKRRSVTPKLEPGLALSGEVVDRSGEPVAGATVRITGEPPVPGLDDAFFTVTRSASDAAGRFAAVGLPPLPWVVRVSAPGWVSDEGRLHVVGESYRVVLLREYALRARLTTGATRRPVQSYRALLRTQDRLVADEPVSSSDGALLLDGLAAGWYELSLEAPGMRAANVTFRLGGDLQLDLGELLVEPDPAPR